MDSKKILITNGRYPISLDLIRNLAAQGHKIYLAETHALHLCRFSNVVVKHFQIPSPRFHPREHIKSLLQIVEKEKIDFLLPVWEDIFHISKYLDQFPSSCQVFSSRFELLHRIHNKWDFIQLLQELAIPVPKTYLITDKRQLGQVELPSYVLKPCYSRASISVYRVNQDTPFPPALPTKEMPWIAQEWLEGKNYCTYSICNNGKVNAHTLYPMEYVLKAPDRLNPSVGSYCLAFRSIKHEKILRWVEDFAAKTHFTGQIAFDFIELPSGELYAIEGNPRTTSGVCLFLPEDQIDQAFFGKNEKIIEATEGRKKQIVIGNLIYGWRHAFSCKKFNHFLHSFLHFKDVVFHKKDLKPFLSQPLIWIKQLFDKLRLGKSFAASFNHDLDFNG